jgi:CheY-like chemotaxis protein
VELAARLRESRADLPVLFVSGYTREATLPLSVDGSVSRFLQKPFTVDALVTALEEMTSGEPDE